jgi:hypothetical protein
MHTLMKHVPAGNNIRSSSRSAHKASTGQTSPVHTSSMNLDAQTVVIGALCGGHADSFGDAESGNTREKDPFWREDVFVSIVSYRDSECGYTVLEALRKAAFRERIHFGIYEQVCMCVAICL